MFTKRRLHRLSACYVGEASCPFRLVVSCRIRRIRRRNAEIEDCGLERRFQPISIPARLVPVFSLPRLLILDVEFDEGSAMLQITREFAAAVDAGDG